jgi:hypothetical protein
VCFRLSEFGVDSRKGMGRRATQREREREKNALNGIGGLRFQPPLIDGWCLFNLFNRHLFLIIVYFWVWIT